MHKGHKISPRHTTKHHMRQTPADSASPTAK